MIKHIVIDGGGPTGLICYGAMKYLLQNNYIDLDNIQSVYGTSVGAIIGTLILLRYDWETLDDYILKRPWNKVFSVKPEHLFEMYTSKSIYNFNFVNEMLLPLLTAKDLTESITLKEFYDFNGIDFHCFTVELNSFQKLDLSYKTHPDLPLLKALNMTSAMPIICKPIIEDNNCYVDGGIIVNYPLYECICNEKCSEDEVLGIKNIWIDNEPIITDEMNIFQYLQIMINKVVNNTRSTHLLLNNIEHGHSTSLTPIRHELKCLCGKDMEDISKWLDYITNVEQMKELIERGKGYAETFLNCEKEL
jgi:predicted acylesterase/phospholipase RssA